MDTIKLGIYQDKLLRRRREILNSLRRLDEENLEVKQEKQIDWIDQACDETEIHLLDCFSDRYSRELTQIEGGLDRIFNGTYGTCPACHQPIEKGRLETSPEVNFCSRCQETRETFEWYH